jgi:hypothetical protein
MATANKNGLMVHAMKEIGRMIKPMVSENYFMPMETYTKVNGLKIKRMVRVPTRTLMEPDIMDSGKKINNMDTELRHGLMELVMRANTLKEKSMAKES